MLCLFPVLTRSVIEKIREKKTNNKTSKNKNFAAKTKYLNLNAPSNNAQMQSDKNLTTQIGFVHTIQQMENFLNETR